ncbi:MAG: exonuclease domain-containing protein [Ruminococcaceae bacterium]|nr:exonuclease domain-containing protein [Oscillospiraceae bacterium]
MQYIVLDMEWNQAQTPDKVIKKPIHLVGEIVQIGAVKLNADFEMTDSFVIIINPVYYRRMNYRIAKLTGISNSDLRSGYSFEKAIEEFKKWCGSEYSIVTWGRDDIPMLRDNLRLHNLSEDWIPKCYDAQPIFDNQITKENRQYSLTYAVERVGELPRKEHDALNDAMNTAIVCSYLDMHKAIAEHEIMKSIPKAKTEINASNILEKSFTSRKNAFCAPECCVLKCENCGNSIKCVDWALQSGNKYIAMAECSCGNGYFVRLNFRRNEDSSLRVGKMIYKLDDNYREYYSKVHAKNKYSKQRKFRKRG